MDRIIASERIASVIKPDSITVLQGDFLATHVALDRLYLLDKFEHDPSEKTFQKRKIILKRKFTSSTFVIRKIAINLLRFMARVAQANHI